MTNQPAPEKCPTEIANLPAGMELGWFRHCGERPMQIVMGHTGTEETNDYQTFAGCPECKMLILIKDGPWDDVKYFKATHIDIQ